MTKNNQEINKTAAEAENTSVTSDEARKVPESEDKHWERVQRFLQEAGLVLDYLHDRIENKRNSIKLSPLFGQVADADGELTDELIVNQLEAITRQAAAGFVAGEGFPVFGSLL